MSSWKLRPEHRRAGDPDCECVEVDNSDGTICLTWGTDCKLCNGTGYVASPDGSLVPAKGAK